MVFVFRSNRDYSSKEVIEWLAYFGCEFYVIDEEDTIEILEVDVLTRQAYFNISSKVFYSKDIDAIWYRGGLIRMYNNSMLNFKKDRATFTDNIDYFLAAYSKSMYEYLESKLDSADVFKIGGNGITRNNKILALELANQIGLLIPETIITTSKKTLKDFAKKHRKFITKSLDLNFSFFDKESNTRFYEYTALLTEESIKTIPETFPLTLFQEYIDKAIELRVIHVCGKNFTVGIFSQKNTKTQLDYRKYDYSQMNRIIKFQLPLNIEKKINKFMKLSNLNTGSLDIIVSGDNKYYFLEVNPIGQFGYNSRVCNLDIERYIASSLINKL